MFLDDCEFASDIRGNSWPLKSFCAFSVLALKKKNCDGFIHGVDHLETS